MNARFTAAVWCSLPQQCTSCCPGITLPLQARTTLGQWTVSLGCLSKSRPCRCADNPLAFDAFLSILFAPQASAGSFDEMLRSIQRHRLPILLIYGREDPWVRSIWGQRIVRVVPEAVYYQVTDAIRP